MKFLRVLLRAANAINTPAEIIDRLGLADPKVMA
jgi:hypothetical protein